MNILPVTRARGRLGDLVDTASLQKYFVLTKGGVPKAAIVNFEYLEKLQKIVDKVYQKTFIDERYLPLTREFTDSEIDEWLANDKI